MRQRKNSFRLRQGKWRLRDAASGNSEGASRSSPFGKRGDFGGEPRGSTPKSVYYPMLAQPFGSRIFGSSSHSLQPLAPSFSPSLWYSVLRLWPHLLLRFLFQPLSSPTRRNWNPPLSTLLTQQLSSRKRYSDASRERHH